MNERDRAAADGNRCPAPLLCVRHSRLLSALRGGPRRDPRRVPVRSEPNDVKRVTGKAVDSGSSDPTGSRVKCDVLTAG